MSLPTLNLGPFKTNRFDVDFQELQTTIRVEDKVRIFGAKRPNAPLNRLYATSEDFCRIFETDMNRLYLLSLLLTADPELAQKSFVGGLEDSKSGNPVFKEWAESWARRTIIISAIRMLGPRPGDSSLFARTSSRKDIPELPEKFAAILDLPAFERFVFVMSVLEGYSARDCRLLLNCSNFDIAEGRAQALQQLGESAPVAGKTASASDSGSRNSKPGLLHGLVAHLAASA
jgi:DNA-directed RNA polymerase specialized sigma24 family protein